MTLSRCAPLRDGLRSARGGRAFSLVPDLACSVHWTRLMTVPLTDAYLTGLGTFLPGSPISNDEMEEYLGKIGGRPSRARARILKQNGIRSRHYAIDRNQRTLFRNSQMAALAVRAALERAGRTLEEIDFLAAATTQGDLLVPGFGSMVHGELAGPPCEVATLHGVCASGMVALKNAWLQVRAEGRQVAVACASELPSRVFKASRYDAQRAEGLPFDAEFLRWMLSDGSGAAVVQPQPRARGLSLKIEWIEISSHAGQNEVCMYAGANKSPAGELGPSWLDYPSFEAASREGAINLKQDVRLLDRMVKLGVEGFFALIDAGRLDPHRLDWLVVHHSSELFRGRIFELLQKGGLRIPEERWYSNLSTCGNVGSASLYVLLDGLCRERPLAPGQQILCMIPESGRFIRSYALLTVVGEAQVPAAASPTPEPAAPQLETGGDPLAEALVRGLTRVWVGFEERLRRVPVVAQLEAGGFTLERYRQLLINLRQQVVDGSRWIARAASNLTADHHELRALFIEHARDEQADFRMLERDYVSVGGKLEDIQRAPKNIGSEALSAWMFHRASQPDPYDLLGAMFIIEGLGTRMAYRWGCLIRDQLGLSDAQVSFLLYHGQNDDRHFEKLERAVGSGLLTPELVERIVKTAKVTARLYLLQLEELGNT